jgi:hypothetical protein
MRATRARRAGTGLLLPAALLLTSACADAPIPLKYDARAALDAARERRADLYAPDLLLSAEAAYKDGLRALEVESARLGPIRDYHVAAARLETALRRARLAADVAGTRRRRLESSTGDLLATSRLSMENLEFLLRYLSPRTRSRAGLARARVLWEEAAAYRERGEMDAAVERAESASHELALLTETLGRIIGRHSASANMGQYRRWVRETIAESASTGGRAILVDKLRHTLTLLDAGRPIRTYRADIGLNGAQDKAFAGDKATPEGRYRIVEKRGPGQTRWYKALLLDYPNDEDRGRFERAQRRGLLPRRARIGGLIEVHGEGGRFQDWTDGCVALENRDMDELFDMVSVGTPVTIVGYESDDWLKTGAAPSRRAAADGGSPRRAARPRGRPAGL